MPSPLSFCTPQTFKLNRRHIHFDTLLQNNFCSAPSHTYRHRQHWANSQRHGSGRAVVHAKLPSILTARNNLVPRLVPIARKAWYTLWRLFMAQLAPSDAAGRYIRPASSASSSASPPPEMSRAKLIASSAMKAFSERTDAALPVVYVGLACPWCHRVMLALALTGLSSSHDIRLLNPGTDGLWRLANPEGNSRRLKDVYLDYDSRYNGRFTAPLYVDRDTASLISNESSDILRIVASLADAPVRLPRGAFVSLRPSSNSDSNDANAGVEVNNSEIDDWSVRVHSTINDGVYKCGFATSQKAYDEAMDELYQSLDEIEQRLSKSRFLCSDVTITEADVKLFPTMFRFDSVYAVIFRVCRKSIRADYPHIARWIRDIYHMPGVKQTCDLQETIHNYFQNLFPLNPSAIVPQVPNIDLSPLPDNFFPSKSQRQTVS